MNPHINEHQIREFAYQIWESEGKPEGHGQRHWDMACKLAATQTNATPLDVMDTQDNKQQSQSETAPSQDTDSSATRRISADESRPSALDQLDNKADTDDQPDVISKSGKKSKSKKKSDLAENDEVQLANIDGSDAHKSGKSKKKHKSGDSVPA